MDFAMTIKNLNTKIANLQNVTYSSYSLTISGIVLTNSPLHSFEEHIFNIIQNAKIHPQWIHKIIVPHNNFEPVNNFILYFISYQVKIIAQKLLFQYLFVDD